MSPRRILLSALLMSGLFGCDGLPGKPDPANRYIRPEKVTDFHLLYEMNCSGCHGADGRFGPAIPLGDSVYLALASPQYLEAITRTGVPGTTMPAFALENGGTLTDEQIAIIARGLHEKWGDKGQNLGTASLPALSVSRATEVGSPTRGKNTFGVFCAECHGKLGRGTAKAGSVVEPPYLALVSNQNLRTVTITGRRDLGMPDWRNVGPRVMTHQEISDVVAWLSSQRPRNPLPGKSN
ncbi:MAG: c-type cytochrome [Myxococcota bacterium]|nr:c-type cytochrome [Myxococcota bacterium]